jgi:ubiquinone/menaquinone biosynthesis C-methylase UbiE
MFSKSAEYYDEIYASAGKDYAAETRKIHAIIRKHKRSKGKTLLDVACGTGAYTGHLARYYQVEGLDLDAGMLKVAKRKYPDIHFHQGDMLDFDLARQYDVVVCLFSSIGYVRTKSRLHRAIRNMARHLLPGGVLLVEPWLSPEQWRRGHIGIIQVERPDVKLVRMTYSGQKRRVSRLEFQYLIGTSKGIEHEVEIHELGLFTHTEYLSAFEAAGLTVQYDPEGVSGRGLYIGVKPPGKA